MKISLIIPVYNEEKSLLKLYHNLSRVLKEISIKNYEIIFIDDGSIDKSFEILKKLHEKNKKIKIVKLMKNFGQTAAMDAGFKQAKNPIVITLDADLQNDPSDIPLLLNKINQGYDVVSGWRWKRQDSFSKKVFSRVASKLRKYLTKDEIHDSGCTLKAYKRECLQDLNLYGEAHRFIPTLLSWKGYKIGEVKVNHKQRELGITKYNSSRIFRGFMDLLTLKFWQDYNTRPLHFFAKIGLFSITLSFLIIIYNLLKYGLSLRVGPTLLAAVLFILVGVQFFGFGFLAEIQIRSYYTQNKSYKVEKIIK